MNEKENVALYAFRRFGESVLRAAYCCTGSYSSAEDIAQDVFLTLHEKPRDFSDDEHMKAWLLRVAINKCRNYKKSWEQKGRTDLESVPEAAFTDDSVKKRELKEAVLALSEKYSSVLFLYYYEGYSIKEIASILNKRESTVGSLLRRGREKLKMELEG